MKQERKKQPGEKDLAGGTRAASPAAELESLQIGSAVYETLITRKFRNRKPWVRHDHRHVRAIIPGTIQKIFIKKGMEVEQGAPLLILEAMKMRNEVVSPVSGKIKNVHVSEGDMVPKNHLLVEFTG